MELPPTVTFWPVIAPTNGVRIVSCADAVTLRSPLAVDGQPVTVLVVAKPGSDESPGSSSATAVAIPEASQGWNWP